MRRWLLRVALLMLLLALAAGAWLIASPGGVRWLAREAEARVPGLSIGRVDGALGGSFVLQDISWQRSGLRVEVAEASGELRLAALPFGEIALSQLALRDLDVALSAPAATGPGPAGAAAATALPALSIARLTIDGARLARGDAAVSIARASSRIALGGRRIALDELSIAGPPGSVAGRLAIDLSAPQPLREAEFAFSVVAPDQRRYSGTLSARPAGRDTALAWRLSAPVAMAGAARLDGALRSGQLRLELEPQPGAPLGIDGDISALLEASGSDGRWRLSGGASALGERLAFDGGTLALVDAAVELDALALTLAGRGTLRASGRVPLAAEGAWDLALTTDRWQQRFAAAPPLDLSGTVRLAGPAAAPTAALALRATTEGWPDARLEGGLAWRDAALGFERLTVSLPRGRATLDGTLSFAEDARLTATLAQVDPAPFAPAWPGALAATIRFDGALVDAAPRGTLELDALSGTLREAAVGGSARLVLDGGIWREGRIALGLGRATLVGSAADGGRRAELAFEAPDLAELLPGAAGRASVRWVREGSDRVAASGSELALAGVRIADLSFEARRGSGADPELDLRLDAGGVLVAGRQFDGVALRAAGTAGAHRVTLDAGAPALRLEAAFAGGFGPPGWRGAIESLALGAGRLPLVLEAPASLAVGHDGRIALERACLVGAGNRGCVALDGGWASGEGRLELADVSLAALATLLPAQSLPALEGLLEGDAQLAWRDGAPVRGTLTLRSPRGIARLPRRPDLELGYRKLALDGRWQDGVGRFTGVTELTPEGRLELDATIDRDASGAYGVDAVLNLAVQDLSGIEAFTTAIAEPEGELRGQVRLRAGHHGQSLSGALALTDFTAQVPQYAIRVREGVLALAGVPGQVVLRGSLRSGDGVLSIDGRIDRDDPVPALLRLSGREVRFANTPTLMLIVSPDLTLAQTERRWNLTGTIEVPRARIDASKLQAGVDASPDVRVIDDAEAREPRRPWRARVRVGLGDDVRLSGFGFDGTLAGALDISQRQGAQAIANGEITVRGRYEAYGQRLSIARGGLRYANSPLDEPTLDLRAERKVRGETVALEVRGTARAPDSRVVGAAGMTDEEALALLVTGRPLRGVGSADRDELAGAAAALGSVGSELLTRRLRGRLGLDEFGVTNDTRLDGEAFTLGKYLSPRLYVGYGIGLLTRGEVFTVRFVVTDRLELEAASGATQRAALNYRIER